MNLSIFSFLCKCKKIDDIFIIAHLIMYEEVLFI